MRWKFGVVLTRPKAKVDEFILGTDSQAHVYCIEKVVRCGLYINSSLYSRYNKTGYGFVATNFMFIILNFKCLTATIPNKEQHLNIYVCFFWVYANITNDSLKPIYLDCRYHMHNVLNKIWHELQNRYIHLKRENVEQLRDQREKHSVFLSICSFSLCFSYSLQYWAIFIIFKRDSIDDNIDLIIGPFAIHLRSRTT